MMQYKRIFQLGEDHLLIEFNSTFSSKTLTQLLKIKTRLEDFYSHKNVEVTNTYTSISIHYFNITELNINDEKQKVIKFIESDSLDEKDIQIHSNLHRLPVCYEDEFAPDLEFLAHQLSLSKQKIIELHTEVIYRVYFLGFLPGFVYLGGLDSQLHYPRKSTPSLEIPKGSVGIGGEQTGIYPSSSPGGWQLIGNCPVPLFSVEEEPPCPIKAGDCIQFKAVSKSEYLNIQEQIKTNSFKHEIIAYD